MTFERTQRLAFRTVSQTAIAYRKSALSRSLEGLPDSAPQPGDRFPGCGSSWRATVRSRICSEKFDDLGFDLIVFGQPAPAQAMPAFDGLVRVHVVPADPVNDAELARARIPQPSFYLVRPDGHVGLCGGLVETDAVKEYLHGARYPR